MPPHPYRGAALLHGVFAALIVLIAALVGADLVNAVVVAALYFVVATGWAWFRFAQRIRKAAQSEGSKEARR